MNDFYETAVREILAYCGEITTEHPHALYILNGDCTVDATEGTDESAVPEEGEEFPLSAEVTVHLALTLRLRPEPTRRRGLVHTWQGGYLVK